MEAEVQVGFLGEVEPCAWEDVIDVPRVDAVVVERHTRKELGLDVLGEFLRGAAEVFGDGVGLDEAALFEEVFEATAESSAQGKVRGRFTAAPFVG